MEINILREIKHLTALAIEYSLIVEFFPAGHKHNPYHNLHTIGYGFGKGSQEFDTLEEVLESLTLLVVEHVPISDRSPYKNVLKDAVKISENLTSEEFNRIMETVPRVPDIPICLTCGPISHNNVIADLDSPPECSICGNVVIFK